MTGLGLGNGFVGARHLMRALGLGSVVDNLQERAHPTAQMQALADNFSRTGGLTAPRLGQMLANGAIPMQMAMPPASMARCRCPGRYAPTQSFDFGASSSPDFVSRLGSRMQGAMMERFLNTNPFARQKLEMMVGGRILPDGVNDGIIRVQSNPMVQPFGTGGLGGPRAVAAATAQGHLNQLNQAAMRGPAVPPPMTGGGALPGMGAAPTAGALPQALLGALRNLLAGGGLPQGVQALPAPVRGGMPAGANAPLGGAQPMGANAAFGPNQGKGLYANGGRGGGGNMFGAADPNLMNALMGGGMPGGSALTVEDMVTLMLMMIMKRQDRQIQGQAQRVNQLQQQQGARGQGGAPGGPQGAPSIDVETMKMKRMIDKRSQMFDMLRQVIDKYNETAKNIIQSVGR